MPTNTGNLIARFIARLDELLKGGRGDLWEYFGQDASIEVIGSTPISGIYRGRHEIVQILGATLSSRIGSGSVELLDAIEQAEEVGAFLLIRLTTPEGRVYNAGGDPAGCWFRASQGKIVEIRLFPDTTQVETELFGHRFVPNSPAASRAANAADVGGRS
jgi:ketosteroid isomerase-like protein